MARESALWGRLRDTGVPELRRRGFGIDAQRIENAATAGHPDVEGFLTDPFKAAGTQFWIELKSNDRPVRPTTPIRPKTRESQSIWHRVRAEAGCRIHWVLLQVGSGHRAALYLVPGSMYDRIKALEKELASMSVIPPDASPAEVLIRAASGW